MCELIQILKLEIESSKNENKTLIEKNKTIYNRHKNIKRSNLRLRKLLDKMRKTTKVNEVNTNDWDIIYENEE